MSLINFISEGGIILHTLTDLQVGQINKESQRIKLGKNESGSKGPCKALRRIFVTFRVLVEISSDGVSEFSAKINKIF